MNDLIPISLEDAKEKEYKRYFTGKPCLSGHIAERYVSSRQCVVCQNIRSLRSQQKPEIKEKQKNRRLQKTYGVSLEEIAAANNCEICEKHLVKKGAYSNSICVDHDHKTGMTRGFLCNHCNRALGLFRDSPEIIQKALKYLEKYR